MKQSNFIKHLQKQNCLLIREGGNHSIYQNQINKKITSVPRHKEIKNFLIRKICKDLEIQPPSNFQ
jgi:predicted RNA binding protein YcfA (HicA-like mRNA interferase family)